VSAEGAPAGGAEERGFVVPVEEVGVAMPSGRSGRSGAGDFGIEALDSILKIDELLIELAKARLDFLEIVGETLDLRGHGVEARAGIGLDVLDGFLERAHGRSELVDTVAGLPMSVFITGVVLSDLSGKILLALKQGSDIRA